MSSATAHAVTAEYVAESVQEGGPLSTAIADLVLPGTYRAAYGELQLARPLFADHGEITSFGNDLTALFDLLASLPEKCFDGDLGRYCDALGMDARSAELMALGATGGLELYGRADAYHDGTSFKLLEFNVGSELGGIDAAQVNRAFLDVPTFGEFAQRHGLAFVDTAAILAAELHRAAQRITSDGAPVIALLEGPGALREHEHVFAAIQEAMRRYGIHLLLGEIQQLTSRRGKLMLDGHPLDVVLRYFTAEQLLDDPAARDALEMMVRAHEQHWTALFTPLEHGLMESKANLALLHDPRHRERFTPDEIRLVDRIVPWTRIVGSGATAADRAQLVEHCRARRESLILKPGTACGGVGAMLGREVSDRDWAAKLDEIRDQDYVAQEIVVPVPEPVVDPATGEIEAWQANWGIFATSQGYAGAFVRALRATDGSVISYSNSGTRGTCVFTCPGTPSARA